jgi:hypothetical protein
MPRQKKKTAIDYDDEDAVLSSVAKELETEADELSIKEDRGLSGFGEGTIYLVKWGRDEYNVAENYDQAYALAVAVVKQDLEQEPELFNKDFIEQHINKDKLRDKLEGDVIDMRIDDLTDMTAGEFWREWEREGMDPPDSEEQEASQKQIEELAAEQAQQQLQDPMQYLEDIYGDDAAAKAIEIAGIDIDAAADDAVDTDGWEHFLARYDGNSHETASGLVYWRVN